jgi:hypothetical protein
LLAFLKEQIQRIYGRRVSTPSKPCPHRDLFTLLNEIVPAEEPKAKNIPALMLLRQNGAESNGWRGLPFWWPVIFVPRDAVTSVFAAEAPADDIAIGSAKPNVS